MNGEDTHAELIKKFSNTSKDIRTTWLRSLQKEIELWKESKEKEWNKSKEDLRDGMV